jgi:hypothetical protein
MPYHLEGRLLEVCSCDAICPCWVGHDPDGGTCDGVILWRVDRGTVNEVDVSGLSLALVAHIPGNALHGNWRAAVFVDDRASTEQAEALLSAFTGKEGGPLADIAPLIGEVVSVQHVPIEAAVDEGSGRLRIGEVVDAELEAFRNPATREPTTLRDAVFSFRRGAAAYPGRAPRYQAEIPALGMRLDLKDHSAVDGPFTFST